MKRMTFLLAVLAIAGIAAPALAAPEPKPKEIHGMGCVEAGVEAHCLVLKDIKSGMIFNLLIRQPRPAIGEGIEFTGVRHEGPTVCMQGTAIAVTTWARKDTLKCTQPQKFKKQAEP